VRGASVRAVRVHRAYRNGGSSRQLGMQPRGGVDAADRRELQRRSAHHSGRHVPGVLCAVSPQGEWSYCMRS